MLNLAQSNPRTILNSRKIALSSITDVRDLFMFLIVFRIFNVQISIHLFPSECFQASRGTPKTVFFYNSIKKSMRQSTSTFKM